MRPGRQGAAGMGAPEREYARISLLSSGRTAASGCKGGAVLVKHRVTMLLMIWLCSCARRHAMAIGACFGFGVQRQSVVVMMAVPQTL